MLIWGFLFVLPVAVVGYGFWLACYMVNRHNRVWLNGLFAASTAACASTYLLLNTRLDLLLQWLATVYPAAYGLLGHLGLSVEHTSFFNALLVTCWLTLLAGAAGAGVTRLAQRHPYPF